ncbi:membrane protein [Corynebacterium phocae]|uniref:Membrane protein n=1 Tax=Corynebacterium phocae TaxID=161895 RepID=A0A1L7D2D0_9CORY|nr:hypothetical protein [Corynebacterium phocae]APT92121.1 membrane protein [Corynebacterium phocae]KAA8726508.1 hypothetical protein F4V58_03110 [Corynebacterium phocae]
MHYTSWDRSKVEEPVLLIEDGPEDLAVFGQDVASVGQESWSLDVRDQEGATATSSTGAVYSLPGNFGRDKRLHANVNGTGYVFVNETGAEWIIDDEASQKVAQFCGKNSGVRKAILEFEGQASIPTDHIVALSWFARLVLEEKVEKSSTAVIVSLVLASIVALLAFFV